MYIVYVVLSHRPSVLMRESCSPKTRKYSNLGQCNVASSDLVHTGPGAAA